MDRRLALWIALATVVPGCDDDSGDGEEESTSTDEGSTTMVPEVDYVTQIQPIWNQCTCHLMGPSGTMVAPTMTLNEEVSWQQLIGTPSTAVPSMARIQPGKPAESYLWHKINDTHTTVGGTGTEMPPGALLEPATIQTIEDWILGGAMP